MKNKDAVNYQQEMDHTWQRDFSKQNEEKVTLFYTTITKREQHVLYHANVNKKNNRRESFVGSFQDDVISFNNLTLYNENILLIKKKPMKKCRKVYEKNTLCQHRTSLKDKKGNFGFIHEVERKLLLKMVKTWVGN